MKTLIIPPAAAGRILPFYLAAEEWLAMCPEQDDEWFFAWQAGPAVICGRHQDIALEVDLDYAADRGIQVWRRKSGGGSVYADGHNVMFSYITADTGGVQGCFDRYTAMICRMLATLGIDAAPTGRNDVAVGGRKVAGNAFYRSHGRCIVHGTMLYDADPDTMGRVLTPSRAKLLSKGVQSVPSRITTLRRCGLDMSRDDFMAHAMSCMGGSGSYTLTADDIARIEVIMQSYLRDDFLRRDGLGRLPLHASRRIEGVGEISLSLSLGHDGLIDRCRISGDFFGSRRSVDDLCRILAGTYPGRDALMTALAGFPVGDAIEGLGADTLTDLIIETTIP